MIRTEREQGSADVLQMPCGGRIDTRRLRSDGVLNDRELAFCRANGVPLAYDASQLGWIPAAVEDDLDVPPYGDRAGWTVRPRSGIAHAPQANAMRPQFRLRAWSQADLDDFLRLLDDPEVWKWLPEAYPAPLTAEVAAALIELSNASNHHQVRAVLRDSEIVGQVRLLYDVDPRDAGVAEISYWLGRAHWGKGIGSQIVRLFTARCFSDNPGLSSIMAKVHRDNAGSLRVLEKAGYSVTGSDPADPAWTILHKHRV